MKTLIIATQVHGLRHVLRDVPGPLRALLLAARYLGRVDDTTLAAFLEA